MIFRGLLSVGPKVHLSREVQEQIGVGHVAHVPLFIVMYIHRDLSLCGPRPEVYLVL